MTVLSTLIFQARSETGDGPLYRALQALAEASGSGSSSSSGVGYDAIYRPGVPSSGNSFATEAEVLAAISTINAPRVGFDLAAVGGSVTLASSWAMRGGTWSSTYPNTDVYEVNVDEGVQVSDLTIVTRGLGVHFTRTATPGLVYTVPPGVPRVLAVQDGAFLVNEAASTQSAIQVPAGEQQVVSLDVGTVRSDGASFVELGAGANIYAVSLQSSPLLAQGFGAGWVSGPVGTTLGYVAADSMFIAPPIPGFLGTLAMITLTELARSTSYDDTPPLLVPAPGIEGATVQQAIDALKSLSGVPYPNRYDLSVNEARVENAQSGRPVMITGTTLNSAGGFTGSGIGNKCIFGFKGHSGMPVSAIASISWEWEMISPLETTGSPFFFHYPYLNLVLQLDGVPSYKIVTIDPNENARQPVLNVGLLTSLGPNAWRFDHTVPTHNMQIVNAFASQTAAPPIPAMPDVSDPSPAPGSPVPWAVYTGAGPAAWNNYSFTWASLLAAYPGAALVDVYTGDGGLPGPAGTDTPTPAVTLNVGDSSFRRLRYVRVDSVAINGSPA